MVLEAPAQPRRWEQGFAFAYSTRRSAAGKLPFSERRLTEFCCIYGK